MRTNKTNKSWHSVLRMAFFSRATLAITSVLIHFSGNMFAPDVLDAGEMNFKNACGVVVLIAVTAHLSRPIFNKRLSKTNRVAEAK